MPSEDEYLEDTVRLWQNKKAKSKSASKQQQRDAAAGRIPQLCKERRRVISPVPAKQRKWRPRQNPRLSRDDYIVVVKPRVPCELRTFVPADRGHQALPRCTDHHANSSVADLGAKHLGLQHHHFAFGTATSLGLPAASGGSAAARSSPCKDTKGYVFRAGSGDSRGHEVTPLPLLPLRGDVYLPLQENVASFIDLRSVQTLLRPDVRNVGPSHL
ncbi:hypothetical protein HPB50_023755 [Hyalomma asiaticum]|uniref:Uncharacterized protein n=1 Tax=Hyalomma asiaticum TaxID=266040 RepID=A0ACB7S8R3_HYAAI|nr:hypothetical protein HPB50_023755 [Hyalomma asiaticum]